MPNKTENDYFYESSIKTIKLLRKHFHIRGKSDKVKLSKEVTSKNIIDFYREYTATVRPPNLSPEKQLPPPDKNKLRGLYIGNPDANVVLNLIVRHSLYTDEILITDPFMSNFQMRSHINVIKRPEKWILTLVNRAFYICALEDWIRKKIITIIPSISYYNPNIIYTIKDSLVDAGFKIPKDMVERSTANYAIDYFATEPTETRERLYDLVKNQGILPEGVNKSDFLDQVDEFVQNNPIRFQISSFNSSPSQIHASSMGIPITIAYPVADITGSFLIFENSYDYELLIHQFGTKDESSKTFDSLAKAFQELEFKFLNNVPLKKALEIRQKGYLSKFRLYLRDIWNELDRSKNDNSILNDTFLEFEDRLIDEYKDLERDWEFIKSELRTSAIKKGVTAGVSIYTSGYINLGAGLIGATHSIFTSIDDFQKYRKGKKEVAKNPMFMFIDILKNPE